MASIKGVMLLPLDAESYRRHMAHHTFLAKVNSGTKTPDSRLELTQLVEERVRQEMQLRFSATRFRVLGCCRFRGHQLKLIGPDFQNLQG